MKKLSEVLAKRREGKRLKKIAEIPSVVALMLENSPGVLVTPGAYNWPEMTEEEQYILNKKMEDRGYAYAAIHIVLYEEPDFRVSIFSLNAPSVWNTYRDLIKGFSKDLPAGEDLKRFRDELSEKARIEKERLERTHGVRLDSLEW